MRFTEALTGAACQFGLELSPGQIEAFSLYNELLLAWNEKINLTAITDPQDVAVKHIIDSLSCYDPEFFPPGCAVVDVGTGAGFPGLPLKIFRPDLRLTLMDSLNKRLVFLQAVVDRLALTDVTLVHARAEDAGRAKEHRERYRLGLSRAVARLNVLAELCMPMVSVGGYFIALKGSQYQDELDEAGKALTLLGGQVAAVRPVRLPGLDDGRAVIYVKKTTATPANFPRRPGVAEKKPL
ncbi:MAG: 16S rRNA (guanine(527)-N(7))-methyltransferase RsmG [Negativicutes bacterium]|nr:16S rRNA (guanine(527)-N(7))-methyltransferase RsmG [Negativicutes bacterium]